MRVFVTLVYFGRGSVTRGRRLPRLLTGVAPGRFLPGATLGTVRRRVRVLSDAGLGRSYARDRDKKLHSLLAARKSQPFAPEYLLIPTNRRNISSKPLLTMFWK